MNLRSWTVAAVVIMLTFSYLPDTFAQSYNCRYAKTADEVLICQSSILARLDIEMAEAYYSAKQNLRGYELRTLERVRRDYLNLRMGCGRNFDCIRDVYVRWINAIHEIDD